MSGATKATERGASPAAATLDARPVGADAGAKRWHVGTLTYGSAGLSGLFAWLLWGDFAWQLKERAAAPVAQLMLKQFGASDFLISLIVGSLSAAIGMIVGPIVSVRSDRHRGRRGRRIPFLLFSTPFIVAGMIGLAFTPGLGGALDQALGHSSPGIAHCRLAVFVASWALFEISSVVGNSVFGGLINDVVPSTLIGRFYGFFRAVGLVSGVVFNYWIMGHAETESQLIFLGIGALYGVGFTLMCLAVKEGDYPPPEPRPSGGRLAPLFAYMRESFTNRFYLWVFVAMMLGGLASLPVNSFSVLYARSLGMDMAVYGKLLVVAYLISFPLSFVLGWLADRFHPIRLGLVTLALYAAAMISSGFAATNPTWFGAGLVVHVVLTGAYLTGTASLAQRVFPSDKFAQFVSASHIVGAIGFAAVPPALGLLLDHSGHVYRYTFWAGGVLSCLGLVAFVIVFRLHFKGSGGVIPPVRHVAP